MQLTSPKYPLHICQTATSWVICEGEIRPPQYYKEKLTPSTTTVSGCANNMSNADSTTDIVFFYDFILRPSPNWHVTMDRLYERMENKLDNDIENAMSTDDHIKWYLLKHVDWI